MVRKFWQTHLSWIICWSASYMQKGRSIVVHSVIKSMEPPVSAEMSHIATSLKKYTNTQMRGWISQAFRQQWIKIKCAYNKLHHGCQIFSGHLESLSYSSVLGTLGCPKTQGPLFSRRIMKSRREGSRKERRGRIPSLQKRTFDSRQNKEAWYTICKSLF